MDNIANANEQVTLNIPGNIIAQIDAQVGSGFIDREEFIRAAIRYFLDHVRRTESSQDGDFR